ncbi:MAG: hypothetical protein A2148_01165 [Chloroflexi bacterium RBG_16_68_14]|nr:MAG: hypothetical protein A2148_01165 [Chloroflexi bacterium RBG_16_68_14]
MDNDFFLDYDEIIKTIQTAEVITFRFVVVNQRLLIDNRSSEIDPPLVKLVPRATSVEERFRSLKQLRPRFRLPDKISAIWWPKFVDSLETRGVWDAIVQRIESAGFSEAAHQCAGVLQELRTLERQEVRNAITGEGYQALWEK